MEFQCYIVDGNALLQAMVSLPSTFGELAEYVFQELLEDNALTL